MKRLTSFAVLLFPFVVGCNKPTDESCRQALQNMQALLGTDTATATTDLAGDVRRCRGASTKESVECATKASTLEELKACDFMKVPAKSGSAAPAGSAVPTESGSAGPTGSAAAGSG